MSLCSKTTHHPPPPAFTLIELLAIMAIVVILLSIGAASSVHWGRATRIRVSARKVQSSLQYARQWAISHHVRTRFSLANNSTADRGYYAISTLDHGLIGTTNYLARGIIWTNALLPIDFKIDGTCDGQNRDLVLCEARDSANRLVTTVNVFRVTGYVKVQE